MAKGERGGPFWGADIETELKAVASSLSLPDFDLLLLGDGSGTTHKQSCGWACVAWNKLMGGLEIHNGATSCGTNNFAELIPYVQALWHFDREFREVATFGQKARVHIVSDSEVTVLCGNKINTRKGNGCLWSAIEWFENSGMYDIKWTHVYRNTNKFSKRCDWLAGETRMSLDKLRKDLLK